MTTTPTDQDTPPALPPELQLQATQAEYGATMSYLQQRATTLHANLVLAQTELAAAQQRIAELTRDNASAGD